jgi:hypothetical protein
MIQILENKLLEIKLEMIKFDSVTGDKVRIKRNYKSIFELQTGNGDQVQKDSLGLLKFITLETKLQNNFRTADRVQKDDCASLKMISNF